PELQAQLDGFTELFNHQRPSSAGGELTAAERHAATPAAGPAPAPITATAEPSITITAPIVGDNGALGVGGWIVHVGTHYARRRHAFKSAVAVPHRRDRDPVIRQESRAQRTTTLLSTSPRSMRWKASSTASRVIVSDTNRSRSRRPCRCRSISIGKSRLGRQ